METRLRQEIMSELGSEKERIIKAPNSEILR